jgi:para-aminobenzoate synthetase / 4-amino-4-deoxychorismate lyase
LLNGVARQRYLQQGRLKEAVLHVEDLQRAQSLAVFNALRGWCPARLLI